MESIPERTFRFAVRIVKFIRLLPKDSVGFAISNQLIRAGTSVGANIEEAQNSPTRKDFVRGMTISLKECRETNYWLKLVKEAGMIDSDELDKLIMESVELTRILTASVKRAKNSYN